MCYATFEVLPIKVKQTLRNACWWGDIIKTKMIFTVKDVTVVPAPLNWKHNSLMESTFQTLFTRAV